ncbi:MAG: family 43 glycosylhydrolase, partial [Defluviitaleaceae bacterium]|nr:family 43 glycosylhydrolase [Defluviitaleaceae bacterium]
IQMPDNRFFMYYSLSIGFHEGVTEPVRSGIGLAISDSIDGPWVTQGLVVGSGSTNPNRRAADGTTAYDQRRHPNAIDPSPFFDANGKFWMVYGSWSGGIFLYEMNAATGFPLQNSALNRENHGYGRILIASTDHGIEGAHILYSPDSDYYYLFATTGGLGANDGYNTRIFRSRTPDGPYEDARFTQLNVEFDTLSRNPNNHRNTDGSRFDFADMGIKILGGWQFNRASVEQNAPTGYLSPGHGGAILHDGKYLKIFHTRFVGRGEQHQIRVHELFLNERGWFVLSPLRYDGGGGARNFTRESLAGDYKIINHGRFVNRTANISSIFRFNSNGTITTNPGFSSVGTWSLKNNRDAEIFLHGINYSGVFARQYDDDQRAWVQTFSAISHSSGHDNNGLSIWGVGLSRGEPYVAAAPEILRPQVPARNSNGAIVWDFDNSLNGAIPVGRGDFNSIVQASNLRPNPLFVADRNGNANAALRLGGNSGATGIYLGDGIINTPNYSVTMWVRPDSPLNNSFGSLFFGATENENWISVHPATLLTEVAANRGNLALWSGAGEGRWSDNIANGRLVAGEWNHVAIVVAGSNSVIYLNGAPLAMRVENSPFALRNIFTNNDARFFLGINFWESDPIFSGAIDDLQIFNRALTANEVFSNNFFTVAFEPVGGTQIGGGALSQTVSAGATATEPILSRAGFVFDGWEGSFSNVNSDHTVLAKWLRIGAVSTGGAGTITSADAAYLARAVALHAGFSISDRRIANLRGLNRAPNADDVSLLAKLLVGYDFAELREMTKIE